MEEIKNVSVNINLNEGNIVISGSEDFVERNMEKVFSFVERANNVVCRHTDMNKTCVQEVKSVEKIENISFDTANTNNSDKYIAAGVYHIDSEDGNISILKKIPGNSKAEKMKNVAMIVLYIRKGKIQGKEIIPICEKHSCYDRTHFASTFEAEKTNIIRRGSGKNWTIELTQPGEDAAVALLEEMANEKK